MAGRRIARGLVRSGRRPAFPRPDHRRRRLRLRGPGLCGTVDHDADGGQRLYLFLCGAGRDDRLVVGDRAGDDQTGQRRTEDQLPPRKEDSKELDNTHRADLLRTSAL